MPIKISSVPKIILYKYKEVIILCDIMHINGIDYLNSILQHIIFATGSMIKKLKIKNIADGITQVHTLYLHLGFNITHMHADIKFKLLRR